MLGGIGGVKGLWIPAFAGMTLRQAQGRLSVGAGSRSDGLVEGVVDLGDPSASLRAGSPPFFGRLRADLGLGGRAGFRGLSAGGWWLLGAFAESSVEEDGVGGDAVVGGGLFVDAIGDVAQDLDEFECAVGLFEDAFGEVERWVG